MKNLVHIVNDEPRASHREIAEYTNNKPKSIQLLISKHINSFQKFGEIKVVEEKLQTAGGIQTVSNHLLNEQQVYFLFTLLRSNDIVLEFKIKLVQQFFDMREKLYNPNIYELSGRVGGLTTANHKLRDEVKKLKRKLNNRVDALEDDVNDLKYSQRLIPHKNANEKLEVLFLKSDILLDKESTGFTEAVQKHLRFYKEYVEILQQDGNKIQSWATNEIEKIKKERNDLSKDIAVANYKLEVMFMKLNTLKDSAKAILNFDIEKEMSLIEFS